MDIFNICQFIQGQISQLCVSILTQKLSAPTQNDWSNAKHVVKYLIGTRSIKLNLSNVRGGEQNLFGYADADFAEDRLTRKSNSGHVFSLNGGLISWSSRKQTVVSMSSTEAEFVSLSDACREVMWLCDCYAICIKS